VAILNNTKYLSHLIKRQLASFAIFISKNSVDALVGVVFLIAPIVFSFGGLDAWFYWINGAAVMLVVSLNKPDSTPARIFSMA